MTKMWFTTVISLLFCFVYFGGVGCVVVVAAAVAIVVAD